MLASLRQATCRATLPRIIPRHTRPLSTAEPDKRLERGEAMALLGIAEAQGETSTNVPVTQPVLDLDQMHHHLPPAQAPLLQFFTTMIMKHGKYALAARTTSNMLLHIHALTRSAPMPILEQAILKASPAVRCRKQKKGGGKTTYVPQALSERQRTWQGIAWIIKQADKKGVPGKTFAERLARQMIATLKGDTDLQKLKDEMHRVAMVNRGVLPKR